MRKIGIIIFGLIFVIVGIFIFIKEKEQTKRCTEEIVGIVTEIKDDTSIDEDGNLTHTYYPIIQYTAGDRIITKQSSSGSSSSIYHFNDKVDILYNPNNVEEFIIKGDKTSNILGIVFIVLGSIVCILGVIKEEERINILNKLRTLKS